MSTLVRLVAGVGADVLLQMRQLGELALADLTTIWFDAQMDAGVLRQVARVGERLGALGTFVGFRLTHMDLRVQLEIGLRAENLKRFNQEKKSQLVVGYNKGRVYENQGVRVRKYQNPRVRVRFLCFSENSSFS
jgi:hypothetical protein